MAAEVGKIANAVESAATVGGMLVSVADSWSHDVLSKANIRTLARLQETYQQVFKVKSPYFEIPKGKKLPERQLNPDNFDVSYWTKRLSSENLWNQYSNLTTLVAIVCRHIAKLRKKWRIGWNEYQNLNNPIYLTCVEMLTWLADYLSISRSVLLNSSASAAAADGRKIGHILQYEVLDRLDTELCNEHALQHLTKLYGYLTVLLHSCAHLLFYLTSRDHLPEVIPPDTTPLCSAM
eukprot:gene18222-21709_t